MKLNIMGQMYELRHSDLNEPVLATNDGVCQVFDKTIILRKKEYMDGNPGQGQNYRYDHVLRHELIHAICEESGVQYGEDEALVDWIAHIVPKLNSLFLLAKCETEQGD